MDTSHENRERVSDAQLPRVVIVGGGFGGLYAARGLARGPVTVTVVDKHNYHLFRPMLYQVATGLLSSDEVAAPIRSILRRQKNVTVLMEEAVGVDPRARVVLTREGTVAYDYLILATGIEYNYFGHEEWKALAPGLASVDDADRIRGKILTAFESAEKLAASGKADAGVLHELMTFVQVGGGTAGVEMAGAMAEMARMALAKDFRHIDPRSAHILLFEAAPRILPTYPEILSEQARRHLEQLGVEVHTNARVEQVDRHGVIVNGKRIASRTVLWTPDTPSIGAACAAVGVFDGVHVGHQALVRDAVRIAAAEGCSSVVVTFDRDPDQVVSPATAMPQLLDLADKLEYLAELGPDAILVIPFDASVAAMPPLVFLDSVLLRSIEPVSVIVG